MKRRAPPILIAFVAIALGGCASHPKNPADPLEPINRGIYQFNDTLDHAVIKPVARGYRAIMPAPGRVMVSNFYSNLDDVVVTINDLLQFRFRRGFSDGMRVFVNTTVGFFGLVDVASATGLEKHHEDFGVTLGKWGVGNGPYLIVPFLGPSTLRDSIGDYADAYPDPIFQVQHIPTRNQVYVTKKINRRAELLDDEKVLNQAMIDPYEFVRDAYLLRRQSKVNEDKPTRRRYDDEDDGSDGTAAPKHEPAAPTQEPVPAPSPPANPVPAAIQP